MRFQVLASLCLSRFLVSNVNAQSTCTDPVCTLSRALNLALDS